MMHINRYIHIVLITLVVLLACCKRDRDAGAVRIDVTDVEFGAEDTMTTVSATFVTSYKLTAASVQYGFDPMFVIYDSIEAPLEDNALSSLITDLERDTTYYVRFKALNGLGGMLIDRVYNFRTKRFMVPLCTPDTPRITSVGTDNVELDVSVVVLNGGVIKKQGICYSTSPIPDISDNVIQASSASSDFTCAMYGLYALTTYYIRPWVEWYEVGSDEFFVTYGPQLEITTRSEVSEGETIGAYQAVDMGVGVLWATCNVGATRPEEAGDYFAWAEVAPKSSYSLSNHRYYDGSSFTKYVSDGEITWELEDSDDAVCINWGNGWRMATEQQWNELIDACELKFVYLNGIGGFHFTSRTNGNTLFLPLSGFYDYSSFISTNTHYLTRTGYYSDKHKCLTYSSYVFSQTITGELLKFTPSEGDLARGVHAIE